MSATALLTFSIGPVHSFIGQARRIADLWAGSRILSGLASAAIDTLHKEGIEPVFPAARQGAIPRGLPNRIVAEVPFERAGEIARVIEGVVRARWTAIVEHAVQTLTALGMDVSLPRGRDALWPDAVTCSWSWVAENGDYARASRDGAELFSASRLFRPFEQKGDQGMKCAICGERNALPDGVRGTVTSEWQKALRRAEAIAPRLTAFLRTDQTRLCLVCAAKRLHPYREDGATEAEAMFRSFQDFQVDDERRYFALVTMDGDRLGEALMGESALGSGELRRLQQQISEALNDFAEALKEPSSALSLRRLDSIPPAAAARRPRPQLIYAGGEDVLFACDPRDALALASAVRGLYRSCFAARGLDPETYTISAAVVFAHSKTPAGLLLRDADELLKKKAKEESGRDSIAIALHKRSGVPVELAFRWDDPLRRGMDDVVDDLRDARLASRQTYAFAEHDRVLSPILDEREWPQWLRWRLSHGELSAERAAQSARILAPFFIARKVEALRVARFLAIELEEEGGIKS
ncbi:MAG TPA: type III-B CRISPR-associated protein Cas10/Cmr2 [Thermoanaerobaculia bacterium]|jgi:CRISPR-associated protein Cmr2